MNRTQLNKSRLIVGIILVAIAVLLFVPGVSNSQPWRHTALAQPSCGQACGGEPASGCTVFTVSKGERVFFGGNDDYINPDSYYWVDPGGAKGYGAIWIGTPDVTAQL